MSDKRKLKPNQKEKATPEKKVNMVARMIRRLSPTKRAYTEINRSESNSNSSVSSSSTVGKSSLKSDDSTGAQLFKMSLQEEQPKYETTRSYPPTHVRSHSIIPPYRTLDQAPRDVEHQLLRNLHSTLGEATGVVEKYMVLRNREK